MSGTPTPRISVVMPNRNHARHLSRSIGALRAQTRPADEIILLDDASDDDSVATARALLPAHATIVESAAHRGAIESMNDGVRRARGDYVALLAADDMVAPACLERCAGWLDRYPEAAFCSGMVELRGPDHQLLGVRPVLRPTRRAGYVSPRAARQLLRRGDNFFLGATTLYRRSALMEIGLFDAALGAMADAMVLRRLAVRTGFCFVPEVLAQWRIHGENLSLRESRSKALEEAVVRARAIVEAEPAGLFPSGYGAMLERRLRFAAARLAVMAPGGGVEEARIAVRIVHATPAEQMLVRLMFQAGPLRRVLLLGWLTVRQRPFSLLWLAFEFIARGPLKRRSRANAA